MSVCMLIDIFFIFLAEISCKNVGYIQLSQHSLLPASYLFSLALVFNSLSSLLQPLASQDFFFFFFLCISPVNDETEKNGN